MSDASAGLVGLSSPLIQEYVPYAALASSTVTIRVFFMRQSYCAPRDAPVTPPAFRYSARHADRARRVPLCRRLLGPCHSRTAEGSRSVDGCRAVTGARATRVVARRLGERRRHRALDRGGR